MAIDILIARFPYGGMEHYRGTNWLINTAVKLKSDKRIKEINRIELNDTPISMTRNKACRIAQLKGIEVVLMIDNDVVPDWQAVKPWLESSMDFLMSHKGPCVVAAPYCGPPPHENIFVFKWRCKQSDHPDELDYQLTQFTREEAAIMAGVTEVAALPTGLMMFHTKVLEKLGLPWFDYEYTDEYETDKATTEDVYFTRNCSLAGVPVYCNWDSWAGHSKNKIVGKPQIIMVDDVTEKLRAAIRRDITSQERMIDVVRPSRVKKRLIRGTHPSAGNGPGG